MHHGLRQAQQSSEPSANPDWTHHSDLAPAFLHLCIMTFALRRLGAKAGDVGSPPGRLS